MCRSRPWDSGIAPPDDVPTPSEVSRNYRFAEDRVAGELRGAKTRARANLEAIATLKELQADDRDATPAEQEVLSRYIGWGGIPVIFQEDRADWAAEHARLKELVTEDEFKAMRASTLNAHYTSLPIIRAVYSALKEAGYDGRGRVLEPGAGVGHFIGAGPPRTNR